MVQEDIRNIGARRSANPRGSSNQALSGEFLALAVARTSFDCEIASQPLAHPLAVGVVPLLNDATLVCVGLGIGNLGVAICHAISSRVATVTVFVIAALPQADSPRSWDVRVSVGARAVVIEMPDAPEFGNP